MGHNINLESEVWAVYRDTRYNPAGHLYEVSTAGRVKVDGKLKEPQLHLKYLYCGKFAVHRMVAETHIPNPDNKPCVDHINGDRFDNRVENLRWVTHKENNNNPITRKRNSEAHKGKPASNKGIPSSQESKEKNRLAHLGKHHSEETRQKMSESLGGENNPMYGKQHLEESRKLMSESKKNTKWVNNGAECRCVKDEELQQLLDNGWKYGRLKFQS